MAVSTTDRLTDLLAPRCATCRRVVIDTEAVVNHGDLQFHVMCGPLCATCGVQLRPGDGGWRGEGHVVSEPWGYSVRPTRFWCARCLGDTPTYEPQPHG